MTMDDAPGWLADPDDESQERYWDGSDWTDRVRPAGTAGLLHLPEHVPELQRALAAATADIDSVEDRLSTLFDRSDGQAQPADPGSAAVPEAAPEPEGGEAGPAGAGVVAPADGVVVAEDREADEQGSDNFATGSADGEAGADGDADEDDEAFAELDAALKAEKPSRFKFRSRKRS
jgi:Protein of unknown function (DUF2510)